MKEYEDFVSICVHSTVAFRHFYKFTAKAMIEYNFPVAMQKYLEQFVYDVKLRRSNVEDFYRMYDDDLYIYVKIANEIGAHSNTSEYRAVVMMLELLRAKCFLHFVVVVTHFKRFAFLLNSE